MITLYCATHDHRHSSLLADIMQGCHTNCPDPLAVLPLLQEENRMHTLACEMVLQRLTLGRVHLDADPCYLVEADGRRRPLACFDRTLQAALAVAATAALPADHPLLPRLRQKIPRGRPVPACTGNLCLALTEDLCDADVWETLNQLDLPIDLAGDAPMVDRLRQALARGGRIPLEMGAHPAPYRLVRDGSDLTVLTWQDTLGDTEDGAMRVPGPGFEPVLFHWQDPDSWRAPDLDLLLDALPVPRVGNILPGLGTDYAIHDKRQQAFPARCFGRPAMTLLQLERHADGHWSALEGDPGDWEDYRTLFEAALKDAGTAERWVLVLDLGGDAPRSLQELSRCSLYFGFHLKRRTVTLTDGTNALRSFLKALARYARTDAGERSFVL